jgi:glycosyltransferase involved in cell wall biosynthesis
MSYFPHTLIDAVPIVPGRTSTGVKVYLLKLLEGMSGEARSRITIVCTTSNESIFKQFDNVRRIVIPWSVKNRLIRILTQQCIVPVISITHNIDILFEPVDTAAILTPTPIVTSIHSSHINMKENQMGWFRQQYNEGILRMTVRRSTRLIAISKYVRSTLKDILDVNPDKMEVVYHGGGVAEQARRRGWTADEERSGGILFVSTLYPHKNADQLIRAYAQVQARCSHVPSLTIIGGDTDGESPTEERGTERRRLARLARRLGIEEKVHFPGRVSDTELLEFLATSRLMVFPSSLEGFGLPALEAMQAGLPLVASNRTSVPEIVGEGGLVVDPDDINAMADAIEHALFDNEVRTRLIQAGKERGKGFSWSKAAQETLSVIRTSFYT